MLKVPKTLIKKYLNFENNIDFYFIFIYLHKLEKSPLFYLNGIISMLISNNIQLDKHIRYQINKRKEYKMSFNINKLIQMSYYSVILKIIRITNKLFK